MPYLGHTTFSLSSIFPNFSLSSAISIFLGEVPIIGTPAADNKFAILPKQMKDLTNFIKLREEMFISYGDDFQKSELDSRTNYTGRFNG